MNYNKYIGLPYKDVGRDESGIDCWGLARLFYKQELGIELPSYDNLYTTAHESSATEALATYRDNWEETKTPKIGDLCLFNIYGEPAHVGIYIGNYKFLHAREGQTSVIESLNAYAWNKRFAGFFAYTKRDTITVTGAPHPLHRGVVVDWSVAGTTVQDLVNFINNKYSISKKLASKLIIAIDGISIPRECWESTVLQENQLVSYKAVPQGGGDTNRMLLTFALIIVAQWAGTYVAEGMTAANASAAGTYTAGQITAARVIASTVVMMAGNALINAIAPVRLPSDPGQAKSLNLFSGASNQANRFGAIPVVLGKVRMTGMLGATPYIDTLTDTSLINLIIIWGYGPLSIDLNSMQIGTNSWTNYYDNSYPQDIPHPVTLMGSVDSSGIPNEDTTQFDSIYGRDIEQQIMSPSIELVNNQEDGNPWHNVTLAEVCNEIAIAFTFPEGMRQLVISGEDSGTINTAQATLEIQVRKYNPTLGTYDNWTDTAPYFQGQYNTSADSGSDYTTKVMPCIVSGLRTESSGGGEGGMSGQIPLTEVLFQWYIFCMIPGGGIVKLLGAATRDIYAEPDADLINLYKTGSYTSLIAGTDADETTYTRLPKIPASYVPIYTVCTNGNSVVEIISHLENYNGFSGLDLQVLTAESTDSGGGTITTSSTIKIQRGSLYQLWEVQPETGITETIYTSAEMVGDNIIRVNDGAWSDILNNYGIWTSDTPSSETIQTINVTKSSINFKYTGYYYIEASADDEGGVYVDGSPVIMLPAGGWASVVTNLVYIEAGNHTIRATATNSGGGVAGIGFRISYTANGGLNNLPNPNTVLDIGSPGFYNKRKDAFNFIYRIKSLDSDYYEIRARRTNSDETEPSSELRNYHKAYLFSVTGYNSSQAPIKLPKNVGLARTALRVQSTNKVNGTVDGVNAIVQTIGYDWNRDQQKWLPAVSINNPASLFRYILTSPANAYCISEADVASKINLVELQTWHEFCTDNGFYFNAVISNTQSVLDVLRDVCAAGLASPNFIDGKWTVVVDKPREYVVQHFTPHNSWGFEATKLLPRLPHAFRVTFNNEFKAYQPDEIIVCNYGKTLATAEIFEELSLPGVTNATQATKLARWHLAQLKLRPERYSLNVDFEYLICNRGDLVRVSHDVPLWGTGTGRIHAISGSILTLTEDIFLEAGKSYVIRVRTNTPSIQGGQNSTIKYISTITTSGWYSTITLTQAVTTQDSIEVDNLFMIGEVNKETQELVVLSIEATTNTSAKLTLMDYSSEIYDIDLTDDTELPNFDANITGKSNQSVLNTITGAPTIVNITSDTAQSQEISSGNYQNIMLIALSSTAALSSNAEKIQVQVIISDADFNSASLDTTYIVNKEVSSLTIPGLTTNQAYKVRARYTNATGSISGPWSEIYYTVQIGRVINTYTPTGISIALEGTSLVASITDETGKPSNFNTYEYRFIKDSDTTDFWNLDITTNNIAVVQSRTLARQTLLTFASPRISTEGIVYRVACRSIDNTNNYSQTSALGSITLRTIV